MNNAKSLEKLIKSYEVITNNNLNYMTHSISQRGISIIDLLFIG